MTMPVNQIKRHNKNLQWMSPDGPAACWLGWAVILYCKLVWEYWQDTLGDLHPIHPYPCIHVPIRGTSDSVRVACEYLTQYGIKGPGVGNGLGRGKGRERGREDRA